MSVQTEITRIGDNVTNTLLAIEAKGVSVPEGANSNDMAALVNEIKTTANIESISADKVTDGTFAGMVKANAAAMANLAEPQVRNSVTVTNDPGEGVALSYPIGTEINVV